VVAGNPLLSIAGQERLRKAFEQLDLLVVIDIYPSATSRARPRRAAGHRHVRA
jgi:anaerobic selenocysteine-containing dehydrogenase